MSQPAEPHENRVRTWVLIPNARLGRELAKIFEK